MEINRVNPLFQYLPERFKCYLVVIDGRIRHDLELNVLSIDEDNKEVSGQLVRKMPSDALALVIRQDGSSYFTDEDDSHNTIPSGEMTILGGWHVNIEGVTLHFGRLA